MYGSIFVFMRAESCAAATIQICWSGRSRAGVDCWLWRADSTRSYLYGAVFVSLFFVLSLCYLSCLPCTTVSGNDLCLDRFVGPVFYRCLCFSSSFLLYRTHVRVFIVCTGDFCFLLCLRRRIGSSSRAPGVGRRHPRTSTTRSVTWSTR